MFDDNIEDGIRVSSTTSGIYAGLTSTELTVSFTVVIGEPYDVAMVDAEHLREAIISAVQQIVTDYADDGQEVE